MRMQNLEQLLKRGFTNLAEQGCCYRLYPKINPKFIIKYDAVGNGKYVMGKIVWICKSTYERDRGQLNETLSKGG